MNQEYLIIIILTVIIILIVFYIYNSNLLNTKCKEKLSNIVLTKKTFIVPSGHFGSTIYYYNKYKENIIGFC